MSNLFFLKKKKIQIHAPLKMHCFLFLKIIILFGVCNTYDLAFTM